MDQSFNSFQSIKDVIQKNNSHIHLRTNLVILYFGFCEHFIAYLDAYKTLFSQKNYYACQAIDRIMLDLYIKARLLYEVGNPDDLADWFWKGEKLSKYKGFPPIKCLTDLNLCKYFDEQDHNDKMWMGSFENRYGEKSTFIHPNKQSALEYWRKHKWSEEERQMQQNIDENSGLEFENLAGKVNQVLANICCNICQQQQKLSTNLQDVDSVSNSAKNL